jgi:TonB family protein
VKILPAAAIAVLAFTSPAALASAPAAAPAAPAAAPTEGSAGLCILMGDMGQVIDARIAQTSGDAAMDQDVVALARTLRWSPPYPRPGWLGMRITLSKHGPISPPPGSPPHCSASSDDDVGDAI